MTDEGAVYGEGGTYGTAEAATLILRRLKPVR